MYLLGRNTLYVNNRNNQNKFNYRLNYFLVYFLFALGGVTTFSSNSRFVQGLFVFVILIFIYNNLAFDKKYYYIIIVVSIIYFAQAITAKSMEINSIFYLFYVFFIPYGIIKIVGLKFAEYYIKITYVFALISFLFLIPSYISVDFRNSVKDFANWIDLDPLVGVHDNFIIYNHELMNEGLIKNPGPFYEAGAFGTFLIIALILNLIKTNKILEKRNVIFITTILSTFSTSSYLSLFSLVIFFFIQNKSILIKSIITPFMIFIAFIIFSKLPFLQDKINSQIEASQFQGEERIGRIQGGLVDFKELLSNPIFGKGIASYKGSNNGLTGLALSYGIIGFCLFFYLLVKSLKLYCKENNFNANFGIYAAIPIALVLSGQVLYSKPIFLALIMMFILYDNKVKKHYTRYAPKSINYWRNI